MFTDILYFLLENVFPDVVGLLPLFDLIVMLFALFLTIVVVAFPFMMVYWFIRRFL